MSIPDSEIHSLKIGDVIYECERGKNIEIRILSAPVEDVESENRRAWEWTAENTQNGQVIAYRLTEGLSHYGPRLYREPQYAHFKSGEMSFPLVGAS